MFAWRSTLVLACLVAVAVPARAELPPDARTAGVQDAQPTPVPAIRTPLPARPDQRAAVRGCPLDAVCRPWRDELREFELEAFSPGAGPWVAPAAGPRRARTPAEVRPDLPWLVGLEMPDLPVTWDRRVIDYLVFYKDDPRGRRIMRGWLARQGRYRDLILAALRAAKLPEDLLYLAMIESSYDSTERSRVGASGLWQFMPDGGRVYGLAIDRWVDERNDPVRATEAAVGYWADLYQRFGDWDLAMAAYNAGYGAVLKGIARFNTNDFWALVDYENALPWESGIYVPKALAAAIVGHNRAVFGFAEVDLGPPEQWDDVTVPSSISLATVARAAGCTVEALRALNPHLRRNRTPAGRAAVLRVPAGGGASFATKLGQLRGDWDNVDTYVARYGERFEDIATQFGISRSRLRALNDLDHESEVTGGTELVVPRVSVAERANNQAAAAENLYGSGVDHRPGEALIVAVPDKDADVDGKRRVFYRVVTGDELPRVASALGVSATALAAWNGLAEGSALHPRMVLQAFVAPTWSEDQAHVALLDDSRLIVVTRGSKEHLELSEGRSGRARVEYVADKRENYEQIGKRFGLSKRDMARINRKSPETTVDKGEMVVVYKVVDRSRSDRADKQWRKAPKASKPGSGKGRSSGKRAGKKVSTAADDGAAASDKTASGKAAGDKTAGGKATSDKTASDKTASDKTASDKTASDKTASGKTASDKAASGKTASDKAASGKAASDKATSDKTASDKTASDKTASDKTASDKTASDKTAKASGAAPARTQARAGDGPATRSPDAKPAGRAADSDGPVTMPE